LARSLDGAERETARGGGGLMALVAVIGFSLLAAVLAYTRQEAIAAAAPQLAEPLAQYVAWVDRMRAMVAGLMNGGG
jgi:formiminotetrahydrofolate cyclodeaminase